MYFKKTIAGIAALSMLLSQYALTAMSASAAETNDYQESTMKVHFDGTENTTDIDCRYYNDMPNVPYIKLSDFYNCYTGQDLEITNKNDGTYEVKVPIGAIGIIDTNNETVSSEDFVSYFYPEYILLGNNTSYATYIQSEISTPEPIDVTVDLAKYHIDLREGEDDIWWPVPTLCDFYEFSLNQASLIDHDLYFCGIITGEHSRAARVNSDEHIAAFIEEYKDGRPKDLAEYNYNELCYAFDNQYGFPGRVKYNDLLAEKGLDGMLSEANDSTRKIKQMLLSENVYEYCAGYIMLNNYLWDGGHTTFSALPLTNKDFAEESDKFRLPYTELEGAIDHVADYNDTIDSGKAASDARDKMLETADTVEKMGSSIYSTKGDTAVFSFDAFSGNTVGWLMYYYAEGELPQDLVTEFYNSVNKAAADPAIKNFVIDLGSNGGGELDILEYMFGLLADMDHITLGSSDGSSNKAHYSVDRNLDKSFDDKDREIKIDLNIGVITSKASFSCGNLMPSIAKDLGYMLVGEKSGGGTCSVIYCSTADGLFYSISTGIKFVDSEGNNIDNGIQPDYELVKKTEDGNKDYSDVYNYDTLSKLFKEYYKTSTDTPDPATTTVSTETETTTTTTTAVSAEEMCKWAARDYEKKNGVTVNAEVTSSTDDKYEITLKDNEEKVLDVYTVDSATGNGTNSADEAVSLPQTGNNSASTAAAAAGAVALILSGGIAVYFSNRKRNEN